jgi:hypothetical protein
MPEEERDIYDSSVPVPESYAWDRSGLASARLAGVLDIGSRILSVLLVLAALWSSSHIQMPSLAWARCLHFWVLP